MKMLFLAAADSMHSVRWITYFANAGEEITWVSFGKPLPEANDLIARVDFHHIPFPKGFRAALTLFAVVRRVRKLISRSRPDILHVHYAGLYGLVGALLRFRPYVLSVWGSDVLVFPSNAPKRAVTRFILAQADLITLDGHNTKQAVMDLGVPASKIQFVQFGVDAEKFAPHDSSDGRTVISIRNLEPVYDIATLVRSIPAVTEKVPDAMFVIAGDGSERTALVKLAAELGVADHVHFAGRLQHEQLPSFYGRGSVYVSTSLSDSGLSMSTAEAMACGLPVVVTDTSDNQHWVKDGSTGASHSGGFVIPVKAPHVLAEKLVFLLTHPTESREFGVNNRTTVEERNSYLGEMARMHALYKTLLA